MKHLFIIDASNYLFRSYFAIKHMTNQKGQSTNALFGFIRSIEKIIKDFTVENLVVVFDGPNNKVSRTALYADYKGHRERMPEDLVPQLPLAKKYCDLAGIPREEVDNVEADDTMGSIAKWAEKQGYKVYLCSSDKDLCQLVSDHIVVLNTQKDNLIIDKKGVETIYGILPDQMIDFLAIMGDASDNIPGIKGFGEKTAKDLLQQFGSLTNILNHPEKLKSEKQREKVHQEKENALLSQKLATIVTDIKIVKDTSFYKRKEKDIEGLLAFYHDLNFNTFLKELGSEKKTTQVEEGSSQIVLHEKDLEHLVARIQKEKVGVIDTETTSLIPMEASIVGIGISTLKEERWYIPFNGSLDKKKIVSCLKPLIENREIKWIGHNIKYDMHVLLNEGILLETPYFDTMIASYLLNSHLNRHNLDDLSLELFSHTKISIKSLIGEKKNKEISMNEVPLAKISEYCLEDVTYTLKLYQVFKEELKTRNLLDLFRAIEMPLLPILFDMERKGIFIDQDYLAGLSKEFASKITTLEDTIYHLAGKEFNLNSPKQLSELLFTDLAIKPGGKKTKTGFSTNAEVLENLQEDHPIIQRILEYRTLEKLRSTYIDALPTQINPKTGRIHCSFNQSGTATGRLSSSNPNLQNIPVRSSDGIKIRKAFIPQKEGWSFFGADYSQIELRLLAHLCGDETLIDAFVHDEDIHKVTASHVFNVPLSEVTQEMRFQAKAVNFGIIYGQQAFGLSKELGIGVKEAEAFIRTYFARYPKVKKFIEKVKEEASQSGRSRTLFGRERLLPEINSKNALLRAQSMRFAVNSPIQGTQADIIKMAMIALNKKLQEDKVKGFLILQIHDELIFECPDSEIPYFKKIVPSFMESVVTLKVPLKVDISIGKNWGEC